MLFDPNFKFADEVFLRHHVGRLKQLVLRSSLSIFFLLNFCKSRSFHFFTFFFFIHLLDQPLLFFQRLLLDRKLLLQRHLRPFKTWLITHHADAAEQIGLKLLLLKLVNFLSELLLGHVICKKSLNIVIQYRQLVVSLHFLVNFVLFDLLDHLFDCFGAALVVEQVDIKLLLLLLLLSDFLVNLLDDFKLFRHLLAGRVRPRRAFDWKSG